MVPTVPTPDISSLLDPELAALMAPAGAPLTAEGIAAMRTRPVAVPEVSLSDDVERTDVLVPGAPGDPDVAIRVHRPKGIDGPLPCIYTIHGGGYVAGSYDGDDLRHDTWCPRLRYVGVSVEYRLAPETPYPGPLDDCYAGLAWVHEHAAELGIDPDHIGIGGPSAGGNLAAGLGLLARDRGEVPFRYQLLIYPMLDDRQITASSGWPDPIWPPSANTYGWTAYLGAAKGGPDVPAYAAPARATDLGGLPPTLIAVGAIDGFSDEDIDYAVRLRQAGVSVDLHVYAGAPHGFDGLAPGTAVAQRANRDIEDWLGAQLAR
jgi:acetyl esterase/lipase